MASMKVACMVTVVFMVVVRAPMAHAITCGQVTGTIAPCLAYLGLQQKAGAPSAVCCNGLRILNAAMKTTADRRVTCQCLKSIAAVNSGINFRRAASLPGKCGVNIPYEISTSTNCTTIKF